eukprot:4771063-Prymnesium_polylepis.2
MRSVRRSSGARATWQTSRASRCCHCESSTFVSSKIHARAGRTNKKLEGGDVNSARDPSATTLARRVE